MDFKRKVVLITGGAGDLGSAFAKAFLKKGSKVCICDIEVEKGKEVESTLKKDFGSEKVIFCVCDVTKDDDFEGAYNECEKRLGTVDILINSAGIILETDWRKTMEVNYGGVVRGTELALKKMGKHNGGKGGHVVNISSIGGVARLYSLPFYSGSKGAVTQYTRCVGHEYHYDYTGVSCSSLCPEAIDTSLLRTPENLCYSPQSQKAASEILGSLSLLTTEEVTEALFELLKDNKPGAAMVVEKDTKPYYAVPSVMKY